MVISKQEINKGHTLCQTNDLLLCEREEKFALFGCVQKKKKKKDLINSSRQKKFYFL